MRRTAIALIGMLAAGPALADVGHSTCIWGTLHKDRSTPINFQWKSCWRSFGAEICREWQDEEVASPIPKQIGTKTIQLTLTDEQLKNDPSLRNGPDVYFRIRYDGSSAPGIQNKFYTIHTFFNEKLSTDDCSGIGNEHRFVVTPTGLDLVKGCPPEISKCLTN